MGEAKIRIGNSAKGVNELVLPNVHWSKVRKLQYRTPFGGSGRNKAYKAKELNIRPQACPHHLAKLQSGSGGGTTSL